MAKPNQNSSKQPASSSTAVAEAPSTELKTIGADANLPAFLQGRTGPARGSEGVGMEDLVIPRLELVQSLSPCIEEGHGAYIDGAKPGMLYNNVTRELYGKSVQVIPVYFKKEYIVWKDRKKGGGFVGAFATEAEAQACLNQQEAPDDHRINDTANQFCLMVHPETYQLVEIVVSMAVTKLKVSRQWNTLIRINGGDSFSRVYELGTFLDENKVKEKFHNYTIKNLGFVNELQYRHAEQLYGKVSSGIAQVNRDDDIDGSGTIREVGGNGDKPEY